LNICHKSKKEIVILKLDFEKAFDMVEFSAILDVRKYMGFGDKWIKWIDIILNSATTSVILNGVPGKIIHCKRGVRQGDPLSPLLFVATAELLQVAINKAWNDGIINLPIDESFGQSFPILQYADDTLLILPADPTQLGNLKDTLHKFTMSTGLKVNYHKSSMVPINISHERCQELANGFGCKTESLPFTYLGLPMGTTKPKVEDLMPMICKIDKRLFGISNMLAYSSRLVTIKAIIAGMTNYAMCALKVHMTCLDHVEKSSRLFLWHGKEINKSGKCLVKWEKVCLPKNAGGLGVLNLREQNKALMIKNLFKFYNKAYIPWVDLIWQAYYQNGKLPNPDNCKGSFWWRDCISNHNQFKEIFICKPATGTTILGWHDKWCNNEILAVKFPQLYSFAKQRRITLQNAVAYNQEDIYEMFNLPLSMILVD
jgi:hypothetical protein